jgi:hypothetical protein
MSRNLLVGRVTAIAVVRPIGGMSDKGPPGLLPSHSAPARRVSRNPGSADGSRLELRR